MALSPKEQTRVQAYHAGSAFVLALAFALAMGAGGDWRIAAAVWLWGWIVWAPSIGHSENRLSSVALMGVAFALAIGAFFLGTPWIAPALGLIVGGLREFNQLGEHNEAQGKKDVAFWALGGLIGGLFGALIA